MQELRQLLTLRYGKYDPVNLNKKSYFRFDQTMAKLNDLNLQHDEPLTKTQSLFSFQFICHQSVSMDTHYN